jgi:hypothetical protein
MSPSHQSGRQRIPYNITNDEYFHYARGGSQLWFAASGAEKRQTPGLMNGPDSPHL